MKLVHKTLLISALLATPFAAAQAAESASAHEAWIKAQKIDIQPTIKVTETQVPAGSTGSSTGSSSNNSGTYTPNTSTYPATPSSSQPPSSSMPATNMPSAPTGNAPIQDNSSNGMGQVK